jgi:hypothetical protein
LLLKKNNEYHQNIKDQIRNDSIKKWIEKCLLVTSSKENGGDKKFWLSDHSLKIVKALNPTYDAISTKMPNTSHY